MRIERRIRKRLRSERKHGFDESVAKLERGGLSLAGALHALVVDPGRYQLERAAAGRLLSLVEDGAGVKVLLELFFEQAEKDELYTTALAIEELNDRRAVGPLIRALLDDDNPHRRHAAARALGWMSRPGRAAALALGACLADPRQPHAAREEAAESLAYVGIRETIAPLIAALGEADVRLRVWAVFGLGGRDWRDERVVRALESVLDDVEAPPGNWWPVGKEALAMLAKQRTSRVDYSVRLKREIERILADANAADEDRRWAEFYG